MACASPASLPIMKVCSGSNSGMPQILETNTAGGGPDVLKSSGSHHVHNARARGTKVNGHWAAFLIKLIGKDGCDAHAVPAKVLEHRNVNTSRPMRISHRRAGSACSLQGVASCARQLVIVDGGVPHRARPRNEWAQEDGVAWVLAC